MTTTEWRKSSFSQGGTNDCVELALGASLARVRDSKAPAGGALRFDGELFKGFVRVVKGGLIDSPS